MNECLISQNILNLIIHYNDYKEIFLFSLVNKSIYFILNPKNNPEINTLLRDICFKKYLNINNEKNYSKYNENNLDDYKKTKNNWNNILKELYLNCKEKIPKEIKNEVYKGLQNPYYIPNERKENKILEYENSTLHQTICYDIKKKDCFNYIYYNKYFDAKNEKSKITEIEPLKKGLFFEKELINFKKDIKESLNEKIMNKILNYSYLDLNKVYYTNLKKSKKNNKKKQKKLNSIIYFLIWLNHTFIIFINIFFKYVSQFTNFKDGRKIIIEYTKIHSNLINFGLLIDEKFKNINIMFNFFKRYKNGMSPVDREFKIYNLFLTIMENNFYQKLKPILNNNIQNILDLFYKTSLNKDNINNISYDNNINETNNTEHINEENENDEDDYLDDDSMIEKIEIEDDEESSVIKDDNNSTNQKIIEEYINSVLDFSINENNALFINLSKIELNESYNEIENFVINKYMENIQSLFQIDEDKTNFKDEYNSLNIFFSFIKKLSQAKETSEENQIKLIKRTKLKMLEKSKTYIFNYLNELLYKNFIYKLNNVNIKNDLIFKNTKIEFNNNTVKDLYINQIEKIKNNIINNYSKNIKIINKNLIELANIYISSEENKIINLSKNIILFYFNQINSYNSEDKEIINILFNKEKNNICTF